MAVKPRDYPGIGYSRYFIDDDFYKVNLIGIMKKLVITPAMIFEGVILMAVFYFVLPKYTFIPFPYNLIGIIMSVYGFTIMGKSRDLFRKHKTTLAYDKATFLITEGIFTKTRNPMYLGMFLLLLGFSICFGNLFSILTAFLFLLVIGIFIVPMEEKWLFDSFGEEYLEYKQKVRRWF